MSVASMDPSLEIRKLLPSHIRELASILETHELWKRLMNIIPKALDKNNYQCDLTPQNNHKYNSEHFRLIENESRQSVRSCTEILLDEWGTSGRIRPALGHLLYLLTKAKLFRAADYVAVDLLHHEAPKRPEIGPEADIPVNLSEIIEQGNDDEIEKMLDDKDYVAEAVNLIRRYSDKVPKKVNKIPEIVITPDVVENVTPTFQVPIVTPRPKEPEEVSDMIKFSSTQIQTTITENTSQAIPAVTNVTSSSNITENQAMNMPNLSQMLHNSDKSYSSGTDVSTADNSTVSNTTSEEYSQISNNSNSEVYNPAFSQILSSTIQPEPPLEENVPNLSILNLKTGSTAGEDMQENRNELSEDIMPNIDILQQASENILTTSNNLPDIIALQSNNSEIIPDFTALRLNSSENLQDTNSSVNLPDLTALQMNSSDDLPNLSALQVSGSDVLPDQQAPKENSSDNLPDLSALQINSSKNVPDSSVFQLNNSENVPDLKTLKTLKSDNLPDISILQVSSLASQSIQISNTSQVSSESSSKSRSCSSPLPNLSLDTILPHFSYQNLEIATNTFNEEKYKGHNFEGRLLGSGEFGSVFLAIDLLDRSVAVKKLFLGDVEIVNVHDEVTKQFRNEVEILSKYKHENLVSILGYSCDGSTYCLLYEYVAGGALRDILQDAPEQLSWKQRLNIAMGTSKAISYLHTAFSTPLIHRDIKSANILLDTRGQPKLCDFGLIKLIPNQNISTGTTIFGTSAYMPREAFARDISVKLDTFSFGVVLLELLTSLPPMDNDRADLVTYIGESVENDDIANIIDYKAGSWTENSKNYALGFYKIAQNCLEEKKRRPTMFEVKMALDDLIKDIDVC